MFHPSLSYTRPKLIECAYFSLRLPAIFSVLSLLTIATLSVLTIGHTFFCIYHRIPTLINWSHVFCVCYRCHDFPPLPTVTSFRALSISCSVLVFPRLPSVTCFPAFSSATSVKSRLFFLRLPSYMRSLRTSQRLLTSSCSHVSRGWIRRLKIAETHLEIDMALAPTFQCKYKKEFGRIRKYKCCRILRVSLDCLHQVI